MEQSRIIEALDLLRNMKPGMKEGPCTKVARGAIHLPGKRWIWWTIDKLLMLLVLALPAWVIYKIFW